MEKKLSKLQTKYDDMMDEVSKMYYEIHKANDKSSLYKQDIKRLKALICHRKNQIKTSKLNTVKSHSRSPRSQNRGLNSLSISSMSDGKFLF